MDDRQKTRPIPVALVKALYDIRKKVDAFLELRRIDCAADVEQFLENILKVASQEIDVKGRGMVERGLVLLKPDGGEIEIMASYGMEKDDDRKFSRTIVEEAIRTGETIFCEDAKVDARFKEAESVREVKLLGCICVPLKIRAEAMGAIYFDNRTTLGIFTDADRRFLKEFAEIVAKPIENIRNHLHKVESLRREIEDRYQFGRLIGRSSTMTPVFRLLQVALKVDSTVLINGQTGTGKELMARTIHYNGGRRRRPFVAVDCSALPENLLESELFGYRKGAFTGAANDRKGAFEEADGGTIFLDEICDASKPLQQKLRRVLQEGEIKRLGENAFREVDVRVISATYKDLSQEVKAGRFLKDLYYRLNVINIDLPPLRERREDIPLLATHYLEHYCRKNNQKPKRLTPEAMDILEMYQWPGNIRELMNTIERAVITTPATIIGSDDIWPQIAAKDETTPLLQNEEVEALLSEGLSAPLSERELIRRYARLVLERNRGNKAKTCRDLEIDFKTLMSRLAE